MTTFSVAEAKSRLSELIERAQMGEGVVITKHGRPVAEIKALAAQPGPISKADLEWLAKRRVGRKTGLNAGEFVSRMRDEDRR